MIQINNINKNKKEMVNQLSINISKWLELCKKSQEGYELEPLTLPTEFRLKEFEKVLTEGICHFYNDEVTKRLFRERKVWVSAFMTLEDRAPYVSFRYSVGVNSMDKELMKSLNEKNIAKGWVDALQVLLAATLKMAIKENAAELKLPTDIATSHPLAALPIACYFADRGDDVTEALTITQVEAESKKTA